MDSKNDLKKTRAKLRLLMLSGFNTFPEVKIPIIPKERSLFPNTENDFWYSVDNPVELNQNSCIYELDKGSEFPTHIHADSNETITILTEGASIEFVTEDGISYHSFNDVLKVPKGKPHALVNLGDFKVEIRVDWCPAMDGWEAKFK